MNKPTFNIDTSMESVSKGLERLGKAGLTASDVLITFERKSTQAIADIKETEGNPYFHKEQQ